MKKLILLTILLIPVFAFSQDYQILFNKANGYYNAGQYSQAAEIYHQLIDSGYTDAYIYFNLGNTYYRMDKMPQAIINYERAKILKPSNEDIEFNLKLANLKIVDKFDAVPKLFFIEWYDTFTKSLNSCSWSMVFLGFIWLTFIIVSSFLWFSSQEIRKRLFNTAVLTFILAGASLFFAYKIYNYEQSKEFAIIFSPSVYVKSAPDAGATDLFILHEGTKIQILDTINDWIEIKIENGNVGWLPKNNVEII